MTAAGVVRSRLAALSGVTALVADRIFITKLPADVALPAIRVVEIDTTQAAHLRGLDGWQRSRVQIDCVAQDASGVDAYSVAHALDRAVWGPGDGTALGGWQGPGAQSVLPAGVLDFYDPEPLARYRVVRDVWVVWLDEGDA
jgi:hypothetical protein